MHILREQFYRWLYDPARNGFELEHRPAGMEAMKVLVEDALWTAFKEGFDLKGRCGAPGRPARTMFRCRRTASGMPCGAGGAAGCGSQGRCV